MNNKGQWGLKAHGGRAASVDLAADTVTPGSAPLPRLTVLVQIGGTDMRVPDAPYNIQARSTAFQTAGAVRR